MSKTEQQATAPDKLILVSEKRLRELLATEEDYQRRLMMDTTICPDPDCGSDETHSVNDFLDFGFEIRECETCSKQYKISFTTLVNKIEPYQRVNGRRES